MNAKRNLIVVSNRLPVKVEQDEEGATRVVAAAGGLVTALGPVLRERGGQWLGWLGASTGPEIDEELAREEAKLGYRLQPVELSQEDVEGYYRGFANRVVWPLFHDFIGQCDFSPEFWPVYRRVNRKFAEAVAHRSDDSDFVWIHDYHLMLVGQALREAGFDRRTGFFLHIPFPPLDILTKMPWRDDILEGLLHYDLLGFQTPRDLRNYVQCIRHRMPAAEVMLEPGEQRGRVRLKDGREVILGAFPISIDYEDFVRRSVEDRVSESLARVRAQLPHRRLILGLDRLDYSKGVPQRIRAFGNALERYPELREQVTLLQVVVPSRTAVTEYVQLKDEIDRLVGYVNGRFARAGWTPIQYIFRSLGDTELLAHYRISDVALLTPLKDGMNLVAKEYCACSLEGNGVLILSEFAGAAAELAEGALMVNPFDIEGVADAIHQAVTMPPAERQRRMQNLRESVRSHDVHHWVQRYYEVAEEL